MANRGRGSHEDMYPVNRHELALVLYTSLTMKNTVNLFTIIFIRKENTIFKNIYFMLFKKKSNFHNTYSKRVKLKREILFISNLVQIWFCR